MQSKLEQALGFKPSEFGNLNIVLLISATQTMARGPVPGRGGLVTGPWIGTQNSDFVQCVNMVQFLY